MRLVTIAMLAIIPFAGVQAQVVIDPLTDVQSTNDPVGGGSTTASVSGGMLGGARDIRVTTVTSSSAASVLSGLGQLDWDGGDGTADLEINYDGNADNVLSTTGLGGIDLTVNGKDSFEFRITNSNTTGDFTLRVRDATNTSQFVGNLVSGTGTIVMPFADFTGSADFSNVENIMFDLRTRQTGEQFTLFMFETTPVDLLEFDIE